jgi:methylenetetrahydrofolate dehydrogenase (NADP+) / methenyltetrahydrofolate cyclohydrolase
MGQVLDGKGLAARVRDEVRQGAEAFARAAGRKPGLALVQVGDDEASVRHTQNKEKAAHEAGLEAWLHRLPPTISEAALLDFVQGLNDDERVDGVLVQLPLPSHLDERRVLDAVRPDKDVDGLHPVNAGLLASGRGGGLEPCTARGVLRLLREAGAPIAGARALVIGRGTLVGRPTALLLLAGHATVTVAHAQTRNLDALCREAEIVVAAAGRAGLVRGDWVREGAIVIDVGSSHGPDGKLAGDVAFDEALARAAWVTPTPGGVGPMTIACLLENALLAARAWHARRLRRAAAVLVGWAR